MSLVMMETAEQCTDSAKLLLFVPLVLTPATHTVYQCSRLSGGLLHCGSLEHPYAR
jgi:hypothetical protein